jgi:hypothetical protein
MPYMKPNSPFLYDDATGDIVGIKEADGSERLLPNFVISTDAPIDDDGRPNGTIVFYPAA